VSAEPKAPSPQADRLERQAVALLVLLVVLVLGAVAFVLYARRAFEPTQRLVLVADDSEGVQVGMDLTFSGFPIGRVQRIELAGDGSTRILVDVPTKDAHWLRTTSVFTLTRSLVGRTAIKAYSGILTDPPLPDNAERKVLAGDATAEIPRIMSEVRSLVANLTAMTATDSALAGTLANVQRVTTQLDGKIDGALGGKRGALDLLLGEFDLLLSADTPKLVTTLERTNQLLLNLDGLVKRADGVVGRADDKLLGEQGLLGDSQAAVKQLNLLLGEARGSLARVDQVLKEAEGLARNARVASTDLGQLRAEVEASLRKVEHMVNEVNRLWPLRRDAEIKLP
jgi:phospholipid/cholesterol/gamma-HCH transport system substrate-binding protein